MATIAYLALFVKAFRQFLNLAGGHFLVNGQVSLKMGQARQEMGVFQMKAIQLKNDPNSRRQIVPRARRTNCTVTSRDDADNAEVGRFCAGD